MSTSADGGRVTGGLRPVRSLVRVGALVVVLSTVLPLRGLAASLSTTTRTLGDGSAAVSRCDTDGMKVLLNFGTAVGTTSSFVSATVSQISSVCAGATLAASVNNGATSSSGTGTVPAGGGTLTVMFAGAVLATDAAQSDLAVAGP
jgi:hypothetical protein